MPNAPALPLLLLSLLVVGAAGAGCSNSSGNAVWEGRCNEGSTHCVDAQTIQFCSGELWQAPEQCMPEVSGDPPVEVEILTYCSEDGCRPGG